MNMCESVNEFEFECEFEFVVSRAGLKLILHEVKLSCVRFVGLPALRLCPSFRKRVLNSFELLPYHELPSVCWCLHRAAGLAGGDVRTDLFDYTTLKARGLLLLRSADPAGGFDRILLMIMAFVFFLNCGMLFLLHIAV